MTLSSRSLTYLAWSVSIVALVGSLYFSEVMHLVPCVLCWYQRILMYPLVLFFGIALMRKEEKTITNYVLPLTIIGTVIAAFHWLLQMGIIPDAVAPCQAGISCTTKYIEIAGFITIPFLSLIAFCAITTLMLMVKKSERAK